MTITEVNTEISKIVDQLKADGHKVGGHLLVAHDGHATNKLKDRQGIWLVVVMPSKTFSGNPDTYQEHDTGMLFVLEQDVSGRAGQSELDQSRRTEDVFRHIINYIADRQAAGF